MRSPSTSSRQGAAPRRTAWWHVDRAVEHVAEPVQICLPRRVHVPHHLAQAAPARPAEPFLQQPGHEVVEGWLARIPGVGFKQQVLDGPYRKREIISAYVA